jgi:hypothetical protein
MQCCSHVDVPAVCHCPRALVLRLSLLAVMQLAHATTLALLD